MAKPFEKLRNKMSIASRERSDKLAEELRTEIRLAELRQALGVSQDELAELMEKKQAAISRFERRSDIRLSTLREFIEALGGRLEIVARFPAGDYHITQLEK